MLQVHPSVVDASWSDGHDLAGLEGGDAVLGVEGSQQLWPTDPQKTARRKRNAVEDRLRARRVDD